MRLSTACFGLTLLFIEPHVQEAPLLRLTQTATHPGGSIDLNMYLLTDRRLEHVLVERARAGVRVRILIAGNPWHSRRLWSQEWAFCRRHPDLSCRTAPKRFRFDHAKYVIFDHRLACVGSANWTWSAFHRNREYIVCTRKKPVVRDMTRLFQADWHDVPAGAAVRQALVVSPGSESALRTLLRQAGPIDIEAEELGSVPALDRLLARKGHRVHILLPASISTWDRRLARHLARQGAVVRLLVRPYLHAKLILTAQEAFVGSQNLTRTSLERNREVGILIRGRALLGQLRAQFASDWAQGIPLTGGH